jgi:asparagine synthetase B (glutamine-hydrolysing)
MTVHADAYYQNFYDVFEQAVLDSVNPGTILSLSGGWDTRVIAGILAKNNVDLPTMTTGSRLELLVAAEVARALNLKHYSNNPENLEGLNGETRLEVMQVLYAWRLGGQQLREKGYKYLLTGHCFDEVNGCWRGAWARTSEQFEHSKKKYLQDRLDALGEYRKEVGLEIVTPILDPAVLACLQKIPWQLRTGKKIQGWILKNKFPKLYRIRYYNSLLPCFLPYRLHGLVGMLHVRLLAAYARAGGRL